MPDQLHTIKDAVIFKVGTWNGDTYNEADLDELVRNLPDQGFVPALKIGHAENTDPAVGYVTALRRAGQNLIATISDIPDEVYAIIKRRGFDRVSCEIYSGLVRNGRKFRKALRAVALLGHSPPGVDLPPLRTVVHQQLPVAAFSTYHQPFRMEPTMTNYSEANLPPDQIAHLRAMKLIDAGIYKRGEYSHAVNAVFAEDRALAIAYASQPSVRE